MIGIIFNNDILSDIFLFSLKVNVRKVRVKMAVHVLAKTSVNVHLYISVLSVQKKRRLGTKENPAPNAQAILDAGDSVGSGMYWIQPPGETAPAQTYCDMSFAGGAWMLASYGYVHTSGASKVYKNNKAIPNMIIPLVSLGFPPNAAPLMA